MDPRSICTHKPGTWECRGSNILWVLSAWSLNRRSTAIVGEGSPQGAIEAEVGPSDHDGCALSGYVPVWPLAPRLTSALDVYISLN